MLKRTLTFVLIFGLLQSISFAQDNSQSNKNDIWTTQQARSIDEENLRIPSSEFDLYHLNISELQTVLATTLERSAIQSKADLIEVEIPVPGQDFRRFALFETPVMATELQERYPEIRSYTGQGIDDPREIIKLELGPHGFHAMVFSNKENYVIEPAFDNDLSQYMVFYKKDVIREEADAFLCGVSDSQIVNESQIIGTGGNADDGDDADDDLALIPTGPELRTYRLALATTGEYASYHGGTKPLVLAAMVTAMNRVNGIYEKDLTITMVLIANTDDLIYLNSSTDPYTNNDGGTMLDQNNDNINSIIGFSNYDIGHVFSTGGGGIAQLGSVCGGGKGRGVTGLNTPVDDVFTVDYVAHEIGHQFGGNHTFNACGNNNNQGPEPYEPGSGVTIMAYAGICGNNNNIAQNSIDQFHVASFDEIIAFSQNGTGNGCATITPTNNTAPTVEAGAGGFFIPNKTPFELTGSATDTEGDSLTYCWEQYDKGPATVPNVAQGNAPLFRTFKPVDHPTRIFPRIQSIVNNTSTLGELMPQFGRSMNFRMTVRDNVAGGGGVDYDQISFQVTSNAGPFLVTAPNGGQNWSVGSLQNIIWDVANTDQGPVNCGAVDIYLSEDGGFTYPHLIASDIPNTGATIIQVPNITGTQIRAKIKGVDNVFFDISNQNFTITPNTDPNFVFISNNTSQTICDGETVTYDVLVDTFLGYNDPVNLSVTGNPAGASFSFSANDFVPPNNVIISASADNTVAIGDYNITLVLTGSTGTQELPLVLRVRDGGPIATTPVSPLNGDLNVSENTMLDWDAIPGASTYSIEVSLDAGFSNIAYTEEGITGTSYDPNPDLNNNSIYFWRVRGSDEICGMGVWSSVFSFQTVLSSCTTYEYLDGPLSLPNNTTVTAGIDVNTDFEITDVNVLGLSGSHNRVGQLSFVLSNPAGDDVALFSNVCGDDNNFNLGLDDDGLNTEIPCPPTDGLVYQAEGSLSDFNGGNAEGTWSLDITDNSNPTIGQLQDWSIELCGPDVNLELPTLDLNGGEVVLGGTMGVVHENILGDCSGSTDGLEYTIIGLPANGTLSFDGTAVVVGTTFTQMDIDAGLMSYVNNGVDSEPDQFEFILACENGTYLAGLFMDITVVTMINTNDLSEIAFSIAPNPAKDYFDINVDQTSVGDYNVSIIDMLGRTIKTQRMTAGTTRVETSRLAAGVYSCQISLGTVVVGEEKVVILK